MAGSGTGPFSRDIARLTPEECAVYAWALDSWSRKIYPSAKAAQKHFKVKSQSHYSVLMKSIRRKIAWMCPLKYRPAGIHGLTPSQRAILTTAWELWDRKPREEPTLGALKLVMGFRGSDSQFVNTRRICVERSLWPCKVRSAWPPLDGEQRDYVVALRRGGCDYLDIPERFAERYGGRRLSTRTVHRILRSAGVIRRYRVRSQASLEARKARVIADRRGLAPEKLTDPAAYRRAVRAARRPAAPSGG